MKSLLECKMILYIAEKILESGGNEERFFQKSHEHFYGTAPDMSLEIRQFHRGIVSDRMKRYVRYLQAVEEREFNRKCPTTKGGVLISVN